MIKPLVDYHTIQTANQFRFVVKNGLNNASLFCYLIARNGVFLLAERREMKVLMPIQTCEIRGLYLIEPFVQFRPPLVPQQILQWILERSQQAADPVSPREVLFYLRWEQERNFWRVAKPRQEQSSGSCLPLETGPGSDYSQALIDLHSHHNMRAYFSSVDNADEQSFRVYAVLGQVLQQPTIRVRIGVAGYFWQIPAHWIFSLPEQVIDAHQEEACVITYPA